VEEPQLSKGVRRKSCPVSFSSVLVGTCAPPHGGAARRIGFASPRGRWTSPQLGVDTPKLGSHGSDPPPHLEPSMPDRDAIDDDEQREPRILRRKRPPQEDEPGVGHRRECGTNDQAAERREAGGAIRLRRSAFSIGVESSRVGGGPTSWRLETAHREAGWFGVDGGHPRAVDVPSVCSLALTSSRATKCNDRPKIHSAGSEYRWRS
jgi:hypothetical protein